MAVCELSVEESIKDQLVAQIVALEDLLRKEKEEHEETKQQLLKATNDFENASNDLSWSALSNRKLREGIHLVRQMARSEKKQLQDLLDDTFKTIHRLREDQYQLNEKIRHLEDFDKDAEISRLKSELAESKRKQVPESEVQRRLKEEINDVRSMMDSIIMREGETQAFYEGRIKEQQDQIRHLMQQQGGDGQVVYQQMYSVVVPEQFPGQVHHVSNGDNGWVHPYAQQPLVYIAADDIDSEKSSGSWQVENLPTTDQEDDVKPSEDAEVEGASEADEAEEVEEAGETTEIAGNVQ